MNYQTALASYDNVRKQASAESASPHKLIEMLYDGALERIAQAKGAIEFNQVEMKGNKINAAISIVGGLRESLDRDQGGDISANLDGLYVYIQSVLVQAHRNSDIKKLNEAATLLSELRSAWVEIG